MPDQDADDLPKLDGEDALEPNAEPKPKVRRGTYNPKKVDSRVFVEGTQHILQDGVVYDIVTKKRLGKL